MQLGRACAAADVHVVFGCDSQAVATTVAGMAFVRQSLDGVEVLVIADGCDAPSIAHLLRTGATEVIATGASEDAQVRSEDSTTLEACMEPDEFPQRTGEIALVRDDMVPLEELWPPLDEPDDAEWPEDVSIMSPPVAELRDGAPAGGGGGGERFARGCGTCGHAFGCARGDGDAPCAARHGCFWQGRRWKDDPCGSSGRFFRSRRVACRGS